MRRNKPNAGAINQIVTSVTFEAQHALAIDLSPVSPTGIILLPLSVPATLACSSLNTLCRCYPTQNIIAEALCIP